MRLVNARVFPLPVESMRTIFPFLSVNTLGSFRFGLFQISTRKSKVAHATPAGKSNTASGGPAGGAVFGAPMDRVVEPISVTNVAAAARVSIVVAMVIPPISASSPTIGSIRQPTVPARMLGVADRRGQASHLTRNTRHRGPRAWLAQQVEWNRPPTDSPCSASLL